MIGWMALGCYLSSPRFARVEREAGRAEVEGRLREDVDALAVQVGERHMGRPAALGAAETWVTARLAEAGYAPGRQAFAVGTLEVANVEAVLPGRTAEILVVGAHYDSAWGTPGADDNASGVAALLELARRLSGRSFRRTVRLVSWVNEEPPCFQCDTMGSRVHALSLAAAGAEVAGALSIESVGYYSDAPETQEWPLGLGLVYGDRGNAVEFVGNLRSRALVRRSVKVFRESVRFPVLGGAVPSFVTGVSWSDHWSYWEEGWPAVMVTDSPPFRNPHYHQRTDLPETLAFDRLAVVVDGLEAVVADLAEGGG